MAFIDRLLPAPKNGGFSMSDYWIWCGSVVRDDDGTYHMFASRWPRSLPFFSGYLQASEVVRAESATPEGPYRFAEVVLPARETKYWDGCMTHNPAIVRYGSAYLLFYIGTTFEKTEDSYRGIRIGLATSSSPCGPWTRRSAPILSPRPGKWDASVVTNPAPCVLPDGRILLVYRSNTPDGLRLGAAIAEGVDGTFERLVDRPIISFEGDHYVEDPFIWLAGDGFQMIAKDWTGMTGESGAGIHAWSSDMTTWTLHDQPKAYSRRVTWDDGTVTEQGHLERPQLLVQDGEPTHLFLATGDGPPGSEAMRQTAMTRTWNMVIPLAPKA